MLCRTRRAVLVSLALALLCSAAVPAEDEKKDAGLPALIGYWVYRTDFSSNTVGFLPDGRYFLQVKVADQPVYEKGEYRVSGDRLIFEPQTAPTVTYTFRLSGSRMTLVGGPFPEPVEFRKKPGSEQSILEEARQVDAAKEKEDAAWRERIKVGPLPKGAPARIPVVGDVLPDPNPTRVFPQATVFAALELYQKTSLPKTLVLADGTRRLVSDSWKWFLYPNGRVFVRSVSFREKGPAEGQGTTAWGRYSLEPGDSVEKLVVETDKGEKIPLKLIDGRRNVLWEKDLYSNVKWEAQSVKKQTGEK